MFILVETQNGPLDKIDISLSQDLQLKCSHSPLTGQDPPLSLSLSLSLSQRDVTYTISRLSSAVARYR